jgi:hypothetical protein
MKTVKNIGNSNIYMCVIGNSLSPFPNVIELRGVSSLVGCFPSYCDLVTLGLKTTEHATPPIDGGE